MAYDIIDPKRPNWVFAEDVPRSAPKPINGPSPLRRAAGAAADTIRRAGESLRGAASTAADKTGAGKILNADAGKLLRGGAGLGAATAVGETLLTTAGVPQEDYEQRTGLRSDSFLGSMGVRAAGALQDIGNKVTFGLADRVGNAISGGGFVRSAGNQVGEWGGPGAEMPGAKAAMPPTPTSAPATSPAAPAENPWLPSAAIGLQNVLSTLNAGGPITDTAGRIVRNGNSYSGSNIAAGAEILDQRTGKLRGGGNVSVLDTSAGYRADLVELARNRAEREATEAAFAARNPISGITGTTLNAGLRNAMDRAPMGDTWIRPSDMSSKQFYALKAAERDSIRDNDTRLTVAGMQSGDSRYSADTSLRGTMAGVKQRSEDNRLNNETERRGQNMALEGRMAPILAERAKRETTQQLLTQYRDPAIAAQAALAAGRPDIAKDLFEGVSTMQGMAAKRDDIAKGQSDAKRAMFEGRFNTLLGNELKGTERMEQQKALETEAYNLARQHIPNFDSMSKEDVAAAMPKIMGLVEVIKKGGNANFSGFGGIVPNAVAGRATPQRTNSLREPGFYQGGRVSDPYGFFEGALSPGFEKGDVAFTPRGHRSALRFEDLSAEGAAVLRDLAAGKDPFAAKAQ